MQIIWFISLILSLNICHAENDKKILLSDYIEKLWWEGGQDKDKILIIANNILENDKDNIVGLLMKLEYQMNTIENIEDLEKILSYYEYVVRKAEGIETQFFKEEIKNIKLSLQSFKNVIPAYTPEIIKEDRPKFYIKHKHTPLVNYIKAYEKDNPKLKFSQKSLNFVSTERPFEWLAIIFFFLLCIAIVFFWVRNKNRY